MDCFVAWLLAMTVPLQQIPAHRARRRAMFAERLDDVLADLPLVPFVGPSTSRCARTWVYHLASGVSWLKPSAPWSWIAVSITLCTICAWKIFAIEFSCRIS